MLNGSDEFCLILLTFQMALVGAGVAATIWRRTSGARERNFLSTAEQRALVLERIYARAHRIQLWHSGACDHEYPLHNECRFLLRDLLAHADFLLTWLAAYGHVHSSTDPDSSRCAAVLLFDAGALFLFLRWASLCLALKVPARVGTTIALNAVQKHTQLCCELAKLIRAEIAGSP